MVGFFKSLWDDFKSVGNFVGKGFDDIENVAKSGLGYISDVKDQSFGLANHLVSGAEGLGSQAIEGVKGIAEKGESIISTPLIIIAAGLAFFLLSKNAGTAIEVGGRLGEKALQNPGLATL